MSNKTDKHFSGYFNAANVVGTFVNKKLCYAEDLYIVKVLYNNPATIVFWSDGTKSISKCSSKDVYNAEVGLLIAILKKFGGYAAGKLFDEWHPEGDKSQIVTLHDVRSRVKAENSEK